MKWEEKPDEPVKFKLFTKDGKPLRILSTSLGIALLANAAFGSAAFAADDTGSGQPKLVEWSTDEVKQYFDPAVDWNIPLLDEGAGAVAGTDSMGTLGGDSPDTVIINNGATSGFGWDDLILYHLLFNRGSSYSASGWSSSHTTYYAGTTKPYKSKTYTSDTFQNKPVVGSTIRPKTTNTTGSVTRRSTSSKPGGIGGKSSVLSSSSSGSTSSSSSKSSSGFSSSSSKSSGSSGGFGG
ncbi:hypothetical protein ACFOLF_30800 [Paenibacillus sepulcri]